MIKALELQIDLAKADASGESFNPRRQRWVKNDAGEKELRDVPVRVRRWSWQDERGITCLSLKHGARTLEIAPGKKAIEVGAAEDLPSKLAILCDAVRAGELNAFIANDRMSPRVGKKGKTEGVSPMMRRPIVK